MTVNIGKSCMYTAVEETNIRVILAVMNTSKLLVEIRPEKIQVHTEFEPMTFEISVQHPAN